MRINLHNVQVIGIQRRVNNAAALFHCVSCIERDWVMVIKRRHQAHDVPITRIPERVCIIKGR